MRDRSCFWLLALVLLSCAHRTPYSPTISKNTTRNIEMESDHEKTRCVVRAHTESLLFCVQVVCTTKSRNPARMLKVQSCGLVEPTKRPMTAGK